MRFQDPSIIVFFLLASPTFARTANNPPSSSSSHEIKFQIDDEKVPKTGTKPTLNLTKEEIKGIGNLNNSIITESNTKDDHGSSSTPPKRRVASSSAVTDASENNDENVKFIPVEENVANLSKNGAVENNFSRKTLPTTRRSNFERNLTGKEEPEFVKVSTIDADDNNSHILPRTFNPYGENTDNISKILLYPVNGTTIVYRETTFRPILPDVVLQKTKDANNRQGDDYLPLSTWSKITPEIIDAKNPSEGQILLNADESVESRDEEIVIEAANFGLEAMNDLYYIKEPKLFSMGLFLAEDNPARYVAAFNDQTEEARQLARFGFAALEGAKSFVSKNPDISRTETFVKDTRRTALHRQCPRRGIPPCPPASLRYRTTDGSCNNPKELWWGSAMSAMQRFLLPVYQDGIQTIRRSVSGRLLPSPREISSLIHQDHDIPLASVTHMLMQWGQFVDHDLTATGQGRGFNGTVPQCCLNGGASFQPPEFMHPECLPIPVPASDNFYGRLGVRCLEFVRSGPAPREDCGFGTREQLSQVTSYLDASTVYSSHVQTSDSLRLFRNGLLQYGKVQSRKPLLPRQESDLCRRGSLSTNCFRAGDGRLSEQPALISMHVIFLRQHNRIATELAALNQHWSDEKLFQETRRIIGALIQHITYREFLPIVLGQDVMKAFDLEIKRKGYYEGYDTTVNPNIANEFAAAAYRFGHSLVQHSFVRYDSDHRPIFNNVTIHDEFNNPVNLHTVGSVDRMLLGLINQPSQKRDEFITKELTNHLFQTSSFGFGMDLASLNIQRGRDHGLPPYVEFREPCGLSPIKRWEDLDRVMPNSAARRFRVLYSAIEDIDLFPAGLAEKPVPGGLVGPTFACIIAQQFSNLRKGDRFWFENPNKESSFTPAQLQQIKRVTLAQILCKTTESIETLQPFVFLTPDTFRNERIPCDSPIIGSLDLNPWAERPPLQQRSRVRQKIRRKGQDNVKNNKKNDGNLEAVETKKIEGEEKSFFSFLRPPTKTGINQQNKVVIRRPSDTHENLTILVQNHAVNSPVFLTETISGSNFQFTHSNDGDATGSYKPGHFPGSQPAQKPQEDFHTSPRPIYYDDTESNPVSVPQTPYRPVSRPKPRPQTYGNPTPYIPHGINDPSNPNPPNYGFSSRPVNNYPQTNLVFDSFYATTTQKPTLYTFYTSFKKPTTTQRPDYYIFDQVKPHDHHQHDSGSQEHHQSQGGGYGSNPSSSSWTVTRPGYDTDDDVYLENSQSSWTQRPIYDHSWTSESNYDQNFKKRPVQADADGWTNIPANIKKPSYHGSSSNKPSNGYWAELSTSTKKYPSTNYYYDQNQYDTKNTATAGINPRPFKKQSVTIVTDSDSEIHHPYNSQRIRPEIKNEVPKPLQLQGVALDRDDIAEHKDAFEIDLSKVIDKRTRPGQLYYDKNVLHRYPERNLTKDGNEEEKGTGEVNDPYKVELHADNDNRHDEVEVDKIVIDTKYQIEKLDPNRISGGPTSTTDFQTKAQVSRDEIKLTTTATVVSNDDNDDDDDDEDYYEDDYEDDEAADDDDEEEITGAYSGKTEDIVIPDETISFGPVEWINEEENSSLILNPEMPRLVSDELVSATEIPKPLRITQKKPGS